MRTFFGNTNNILEVHHFDQRLHASDCWSFRRLWMVFCLCLSDSLSLLLAYWLAVGVRRVISSYHPSGNDLGIAPLWIVLIGAYAWKGLYPAVGISPIDELRLLTSSTCLGFLVIAGSILWSCSAADSSLYVLLFSWIFSLLFVQGGRWLARMLAVRFHAWGEPVAVIGCGTQGQKVADFLSKHARYGMRPSVVITDQVVYPNPEIRRNHFAKLPVYMIDNVGMSGLDRQLPSSFPGIQTAILVVAETSRELRRAVVDEQLFGFQRLILISNLYWVSSLGVSVCDFEGLLSLEVRQNLRDPWQQAIKRALDIFCVLMGGLLALPAIALIALLIRLDSPGSSFYCQERLGKSGRKFKVWKFRTMVENADQILASFLEGDPHALQEWKENRKIKNDPRITRFGKFLRRTSLDELPQLWNVLKGEMSLVGPRPIVPDEIHLYSEGYKLYMHVLPGMTGFWQVSGRNRLEYADRVRLDEYYVRNWSIWLDIYILLKTILTIIRRDGAY